MNITEEFEEDARGWFARGKQELDFHQFNKAYHSFEQTLYLIKKYPDKNYYQNNKYLVLYHKIMALLYMDGRQSEARKVFETIDQAYRIFPEVKATEIRLLIVEKNFQQAASILSVMSISYQQEIENWSSYKLTGQKLMRLSQYVKDATFLKRLELIIDVFYPNKHSLMTKLKELYSDIPQKLDGVKELILKTTRYNREFSIDRHLITDLFFNLFIKILECQDQKHYTLAYTSIKRCAELTPEEPTFKIGMTRFEEKYGRSFGNKPMYQ